PAARGEGAQVRGEVRRADQLEDDVEGAVGLEASGLYHGGAELLHARAEGLVSDGGRHPRARRAPELDRRGAHPSRGAVHQQMVPGGERGLGEERVVRGGEDLGKPARLGPAEWVREGMASRSWTTASSACPPAATTAMTRSPSAKRVAPGPM